MIWAESWEFNILFIDSIFVESPRIYHKRSHLTLALSSSFTFHAPLPSYSYCFHPRIQRHPYQPNQPPMNFTSRLYSQPLLQVNAGFLSTQQQEISPHLISYPLSNYPPTTPSPQLLGPSLPFPKSASSRTALPPYPHPRPPHA